MSTKKATGPCYGCTKRTVEPNCHTTCKEYLAFVAEKQRIHKIRNQEAQLNNLLNSYNSNKKTSPKSMKHRGISIRVK